MRLSRKIAGTVRIVWLLLPCCTAPNPAFWRVGPAADASDPAPGGSDSARLDPDANSPDAPADVAPPDLGTDASTPPAGCGIDVANISGVEGADGVVIDTDGTVYFLTDDATHSYVGRIRPGEAPLVKWLRVDNSPVTWGLGLDSQQRRLYVLVVSGRGAVVAFDDIDGAAAGRTVITGLDNPNDLVVAADGSVYYTNQGDRHVYRISRDGGPATRVTKLAMPLGDPALEQAPAALTMDSDQSLIVGLEHGGPLYKIALTAGQETSRAVFGTWTGWANGLTFDRRHRLYIAIYDDTDPKAVVRLETDGKITTLTSGGRFSSIAFGRGSLDCRDLYVADPYGPMRRVRVPDSL
jgi:sugar lactone lactonase YvrE